MKRLLISLLTVALLATPTEALARPGTKAPDPNVTVTADWYGNLLVVKQHEVRTRVRRVPKWRKAVRYKVWGNPVPLPDASGRIVTYAPGCKLDAGAAASLDYISAVAGVAYIHTVSCWRSHYQQAALYASKPWLAAVPGTSKHEQGRAIDVNLTWLRQHPRVHTLLRLFGWQQFAPSYEPWHYSYRVRG